LPSSRRTSAQSAIRCNGAYAPRNMTSDRCRPTTPPTPQLRKAELRNYLRAPFAGPCTGELAGAGLVGPKEAGKSAVALAFPRMKAVGTPGCEKGTGNRTTRLICSDVEQEAHRDLPGTLRSGTLRPGTLWPGTVPSACFGSTS
jgi:hypothetical protein